MSGSMDKDMNLGQLLAWSNDPESSRRLVKTICSGSPQGFGEMETSGFFLKVSYVK